MQIIYFHSYVKSQRIVSQTASNLGLEITSCISSSTILICYSRLYRFKKLRSRIVSIGLSHKFTCVRSVDCCCLSTSLCVIGRVRSSRHTSTVCAASSRYYTACNASVVDAVEFRFHEQPMDPFHSLDSCFLYEFKSSRNSAVTDRPVVVWIDRFPRH